MRAITFSGPIAHTHPLFLDLQIFKLEDICCIYISFLPLSVSMALLQFILWIILLRSLNFINIIPEVPPVVTFFLLEKIQCNMSYRSICFNGVKSWNTIPLNHGIQFHLTFETLHPLASSKKNLKIFSLTLIVTERD